MRAVDLLPCPFCGGTPILYLGRGAYGVKCSCSGKAWIHTYAGGFINPPRSREDAISSAIAAWNRRAPVSAPAPAMEAEPVAGNPREIWAQVTTRCPERGTYSIKPVNDVGNVRYVRGDLARPQDAEGLRGEVERLTAELKAMTNRAEVAEYKRRIAVEEVQSMIIARAERAEAERDESRSLNGQYLAERDAALARVAELEGIYEQDSAHIQDMLASLAKVTKERDAATAALTPQPDATTREAAMVTLRRDADGEPTVWCDPEIADLIDALNTQSLSTVASCSGHGVKPGFIAMSDGRVMRIFPSLDEARMSAITALRTRPVGEAWQGIETAPKDGTEFLIAYSDGSVRVGRYLDNSKTAWPWAGFRPLYGVEAAGVKITHWRPLPAGPGDAMEGGAV